MDPSRHFHGGRHHALPRRSAPRVSSVIALHERASDLRAARISSYRFVMLTPRSILLALVAVTALGCAKHPAAQPVPLPLPPPVPWSAPAPPPPVVAPAPPIVFMQRIEFDVASPLVRDEDLATLAHIAELLKQHPNVRLVEVCGHSDDGGELDPNFLLSQQRAEAVRAQLVSKGVEGPRLRTRAYGKSIPIYPNDTPQNRAHNRRVEFRILTQ